MKKVPLLFIEVTVFAVDVSQGISRAETLLSWSTQVIRDLSSQKYLLQSHSMKLQCIIVYYSPSG